MQKLELYDYLRSLMLPLKEIDEYLPKAGTIIDLGCGEGVIAKFISNGKRRKVIGIDLNKKRLPKASSKNLTFKIGDIKTYNLTRVDGVILSDVLHHINFKDQKLVLKNVAKKLKKGGILIIKEIDTGEFVRSRLSNFWDFVFYPKEKIYFNDGLKLKSNLKSLGFKVKLKRPMRLFPGSTTLFICKK